MFLCSVKCCFDNVSEIPDASIKITMITFSRALNTVLTFNTMKIDESDIFSLVFDSNAWINKNIEVYNEYSKRQLESSQEKKEREKK